LVAAAGISAVALVSDLRKRRRSLSAPLETYSRTEALDMAPAIYPERAVPLSQVTAEDLLLFASAEVLHTSDAYTPASLERLVAERGLHIGHTYLLNRLPYLAGIFTAPNGPYHLSRYWIEMLDALTDSVRAGRIWNPTMSELAEWVRATQLICTEPVGARTVRLHNASGSAMRNVSLLLPTDVSAADLTWNGVRPAGVRSWGDWLCVWGDVPAGGAAVVCWGPEA
jgi:hypothetical protein